MRNGDSVRYWRESGRGVCWGPCARGGRESSAASSVR